MDDLLLLAVTAGNGHNGIGLSKLCLGHNRPPAAMMLVVGRLSVNRMAVNLAVENWATGSQFTKCFPFDDGLPLLAFSSSAPCRSIASTWDSLQGQCRLPQILFSFRLRQIQTSPEIHLVVSGR